MLGFTHWRANKVPIALFHILASVPFIPKVHQTNKKRFLAFSGLVRELMNLSVNKHIARLLATRRE